MGFSPLHLRAGGTSVLLDPAPTPHVIYAGPALPDMDAHALAAYAASEAQVLMSGSADAPMRVGILAEESAGWEGEPGVELTRRGRLIPSALTTRALESGGAGDQPWPLTGPDATPVGAWARMRVADESAGVEGDISVQVTETGIVRLSASVTNVGEGDLGVTRLVPALPLPAGLTRYLDQAGRHLRERDTFTHELTIGVHRRQTRQGRNHCAASVFGAVAAGTGAEVGRAYLGHVEWSGNVEQWVERMPFGVTVLAGGELLRPGEVELAPGQTYSSPWLSVSWGDGLGEVSARFHDYVRAFDAHPERPRPVTLNAWEAVYFNQSMEELAPLVEAAARVGVERFVLDDGWFGSRRDDTRGLGEWHVSPEVWPQGLAALSDLVHDRGMEFGLWFEPEMVNPGSDVALDHPEWILGPLDRDPLLSRHQLGLNLAAPGASEYLFEAISAVVEEARVDYIKWDYNRDLIEAFDRTREGRYGMHAQTVALYGLLDRLHERFPALEIESCAGGGGRIDLGIMRRAQRVWGSDCIDPIERQVIHAGTSLLLPPELIGAHIASPTSHTTGRTHVLQLRAIAALFYHLGIEWDLRGAQERELEELAEWVAAYKTIRRCAHTGRLVTADGPDCSTRLVGVVGEDVAYYALIEVATSVSRPVGPMRLPGLAPEATYRVDVPSVGDNDRLSTYPHDGAGGAAAIAVPAWWHSGITVPGALLLEAGLPAPLLNPERAVLVRARRV